jgi:hypothetical protein
LRESSSGRRAVSKAAISLTVVRGPCRVNGAGDGRRRSAENAFDLADEIFWKAGFGHECIATSFLGPL